uniref:Serine/threonine protein phosphatase 7 long form isogeny n=1 Tax=Cajanus cajan TaxID=3821 RepID=A0A151S1V4_CAJCA|nr:Serine/threonine protein phosphatase 7 long form isogeny [Cajanus cajan]
MSTQMIHVGPIDDSLLRLQPFHISKHIWNGAEDNVLKVRRATQSELRGVEIPFVWQPYLELLPTLPPYCFENSQVWRSTVPLIDFHIVEYHYADRVMQQFGMVQHIPAPPIHPEKLHDLSLRGKDNTDWSRMHVQFVQEWQSQLHHVWTQLACDTPHLSNSSEYMVWYRKHTRR